MASDVVSNAKTARDAVPSGAVKAGAIVLVLSVACAAFGRYADIGTYHVPQRPVTASVEIAFADAPDGSVIVSEKPGDKSLVTLAPGTNGFIRGTMRGLVRDRRMRSLGAELPFILARHDNGHLTLSDPATGRMLELNGFGVTNIGAFENIMQAAGRRG